MADFAEHILVPTDFSAAAFAAFRRACDLGRPLQARVTLLHVKPWKPSAPGGLDAIQLLHAVLYAAPTHKSAVPTPWPDIHKNDPAHEHLNDIADSDWSIGVEVDTLLSQGDVAAEILRVAQELPTTLIVMGARVPSAAAERDRVVEKVLQASHGPVMLVPGGQTKAHKKRINA